MRNQELKQKLWNLVEERKDELLAICADLIKIPSVTPQQCESIVDFVTAYLSDAGISYQVVRGPDETPSILAQVGNGGKTAIINGHNDVVPVGELNRWDFSPYCGTITDRQILGRGTSDMKCGVGIGLFLAKLIQQEKLGFSGTLKLQIVHDEESGGEKGSMWLIENGYADGADFVLIPEPTSYNNVEVGQKGSMRIRITTTGTPVNGSIINYVGENAVHKMVKILDRMGELAQLEGTWYPNQEQVLRDSKDVIRDSFGVEGVEDAIDHVNVNIMWVDGGLSGTMTPEVCQAMVATLVPVGISTQAVKDKIDQIIAEEGMRGVTVEYPRCKDGACTDVDTDLVRSAVDNAQAVWGRKVVPAYQWATSDAKFFRYRGIPTIQYGPANTEGIHAYNENVDIEDVVNCAKTYMGILEDLIGFDF